jgi:hypothetical protein
MRRGDRRIRGAPRPRGSRTRHAPGRGRAPRSRAEEALRDLQAASVTPPRPSHQLRRYLQKLEVDPARLAELDRRLRRCTMPRASTASSPRACPDALGERRERAGELGGEESLEKLREQEAAAEAAYREKAQALSKVRRAAATRLGSEVTKTMQRLAMEGGRLAGHAGAAGGTRRGRPRGGGAAGRRARRPAAGAAVARRLGRRALAPVARDPGAAVGARFGADAGLRRGRFRHRRGRGRDRGPAPAILAAHHQVLCVTHLAQVATHARAQFRVAKHAGPRGTTASRATARSRGTYRRGRPHAGRASRSPRPRGATLPRCCKTRGLRVHQRRRARERRRRDLRSRLGQEIHGGKFRRQVSCSRAAVPARPTRSACCRR